MTAYLTEALTSLAARGFDFDDSDRVGGGRLELLQPAGFFEEDGWILTQAAS